MSNVDIFINFCDTVYTNLLNDYQHIIIKHEAHLEEINTQILSNSDGSNSPKNVKGGRIIGGKGGNISGGHTIRGKGHQTSNSPPTNKSGGNGGVSSPWATGVLNFFKIGQK